MRVLRPSRGAAGSASRPRAAATSVFPARSSGGNLSRGRIVRVPRPVTEPEARRSNPARHAASRRMNSRSLGSLPDGEPAMSVAKYRAENPLQRQSWKKSPAGRRLSPGLPILRVLQGVSMTRSKKQERAEGLGLPKAPTGIQGFDEVTGGGLP